ncbi:hypothetical protein DL95DRAFT_459069 [Leptodontidium sp. 2 PMI_412]|nr:hypothetical protein DL95DRAFT_459069 [Leptodontidium sp. 2 PMI_412]
MGGTNEAIVYKFDGDFLSFNWSSPLQNIDSFNTYSAAAQNLVSASKGRLLFLHLIISFPHNKRLITYSPVPRSSRGFDRSGISRSRNFLLDTSYQDTAYGPLINNYRLMSDKELGKSIAIKENDVGHYVKLESSPGQLYIDEEAPIARFGQLFGEGTTCYRARRPGSQLWDHVVKFKWLLDCDDNQEENLWKVATATG